MEVRIFSIFLKIMGLRLIAIIVISFSLRKALQKPTTDGTNLSPGILQFNCARNSARQNLADILVRFYLIFVMKIFSVRLAIGSTFNVLSYSKILIYASF